jgi:hypothetical protein
MPGRSSAHSANPYKLNPCGARVLKQCKDCGPQIVGRRRRISLRTLTGICEGPGLLFACPHGTVLAQAVAIGYQFPSLVMGSISFSFSFSPSIFNSGCYVFRFDPPEAEDLRSQTLLKTVKGCTQLLTALTNTLFSTFITFCYSRKLLFISYSSPSGPL